MNERQQYLTDRIQPSVVRYKEAAQKGYLRQCIRNQAAKTKKNLSLADLQYATSRKVLIIVSQIATNFWTYLITTLLKDLLDINISIDERGAFFPLVNYETTRCCKFLLAYPPPPTPVPFSFNCLHLRKKLSTRYSFYESLRTTLRYFIECTLPFLHMIINFTLSIFILVFFLNFQGCVNFINYAMPAISKAKLTSS